MTTTNQAFIKAYRHDAAQAAPTSPAITGAAPPVPIGAITGAESASSATVERSALYGPRPANIAAPDAKSPTRSTRGTADKKPLSSFLARPLKATPDATSADSEFLRPGTLIASFQWPSVCRVLARQCGALLDAVTDRLLTEAEAGRSLIGVLGLQTGRGATTIALCLAARLARRDCRVILVDGNFCNPRLASWLEAAPIAGWQEVLKRGVPLADAVVRATENRLDLLALDGPKPADALRLVGGLQAVVTAGVLRHAYDVVLVDAGAFFDAAAQPIVLELARNMGLDAVLGVAGPEPADARDLDILAAHLSRSGCDLLGTIVNRVAKSYET